MNRPELDRDDIRSVESAFGDLGYDATVVATGPSEYIDSAGRGTQVVFHVGAGDGDGERSMPEGARRSEDDIRDRLAKARDAEDRADPSRAYHKRMCGWREALEWVLGDDGDS